MSPCALARVKLPCSSQRRDPLRYCKVLAAVDPQATDGFGFHGEICRPGSAIELTGEPAVALECAGPASRGWGHSRAPVVYILWSFNFEMRDWVEIARSCAVSSQWAIELREAAKRALNPEPQPVLLDFETKARRALSALDREMEDLPEQERSVFLALYHDELASRIAAV